MKTPDTRHRQPYLPTLIDRLQDDAPRRASEHPDQYAPSAARMRDIVLRDLTLLLNTTGFADHIDSALQPLVAASVINYGLPPMSGSYLADHNWMRMEAAIRTAIVRFEPRLVPESLMITPLGANEGSRFNVLTFELRGLVNLSPYPLEFRVQSALDLETSKVTLLPVHSSQG
jgi:type VI secretion system protein ImpF